MLPPIKFCTIIDNGVCQKCENNYDLVGGNIFLKDIILSEMASTLNVQIDIFWARWSMFTSF